MFEFLRRTEEAAPLSEEFPDGYLDLLAKILTGTGRAHFLGTAQLKIVPPKPEGITADQISLQQFATALIEKGWDLTYLKRYAPAEVVRSSSVKNSAEPAKRPSINPIPPPTSPRSAITTPPPSIDSQPTIAASPGTEAVLDERLEGHHMDSLVTALRSVLSDPESREGFALDLKMNNLTPDFFDSFLPEASKEALKSEPVSRKLEEILKDEGSLRKFAIGLKTNFRRMTGDSITETYSYDFFRDKLTPILTNPSLRQQLAAKYDWSRRLDEDFGDAVEVRQFFEVDKETPIDTELILDRLERIATDPDKVLQLSRILMNDGESSAKEFEKTYGSVAGS